VRAEEALSELERDFGEDMVYEVQDGAVSRVVEEPTAIDQTALVRSVWFTPHVAVDLWDFDNAWKSRNKKNAELVVSKKRDIQIAEKGYVGMGEIPRYAEKATKKDRYVESKGVFRMTERGDTLRWEGEDPVGPTPLSEREDDTLGEGNLGTAGEEWTEESAAEKDADIYTSNKAMETDDEGVIEALCNAASSGVGEVRAEIDYEERSIEAFNEVDSEVGHAVPNAAGKVDSEYDNHGEVVEHPAAAGMENAVREGAEDEPSVEA